MALDVTDLMQQIAGSGSTLSQTNIDEIMLYGRAQWKHDLNHSKQNMEERKLYACWIFQFTCIWCIGLFIVLIGCGAGKLHLSTTVLTTFIGSTTINVFIFFKLVTEYLFNKDNPHK